MSEAEKARLRGIQQMEDENERERRAQRQREEEESRRRVQDALDQVVFYENDLAEHQKWWNQTHDFDNWNYYINHPKDVQQLLDERRQTYRDRLREHRGNYHHGVSDFFVK
jgi:hypothetical protein